MSEYSIIYTVIQDIDKSWDLAVVQNTMKY